MVSPSTFIVIDFGECFGFLEQVVSFGLRLWGVRSLEWAALFQRSLALPSLPSFRTVAAAVSPMETPALEQKPCDDFSSLLFSCVFFGYCSSCALNLDDSRLEAGLNYGTLFKSLWFLSSSKSFTFDEISAKLNHLAKWEAKGGHTHADKQLTLSGYRISCKQGSSEARKKTITSRKANYRMNRINYKESELCSAISWEGSKDVSETWRHNGICHKKRIGCSMYFLYGSVLLVALLNPRARTLSENQPYPTHFLSSLTCHVISLSST